MPLTSDKKTDNYITDFTRKLRNFLCFNVGLNVIIMIINKSIYHFYTACISQAAMGTYTLFICFAFVCFDHLILVFKYVERASTTSRLIIYIIYILYIIIMLNFLPELKATVLSLYQKVACALPQNKKHTLEIPL